MLKADNLYKTIEFSRAKIRKVNLCGTIFTINPSLEPIYISDNNVKHSESIQHLCVIIFL